MRRTRFIGALDGAQVLQLLTLDTDGRIAAITAFVGIGPETFYPDEPPPPPRIHVAEAARRTIGALDGVPGSVLTIAEEPDEG
jgi:hypothetical protein